MLSILEMKYTGYTKNVHNNGDFNYYRILFFSQSYAPRVYSI